MPFYDAMSKTLFKHPPTLTYSTLVPQLPLLFADQSFGKQRSILTFGVVVRSSWVTTTIGTGWEFVPGAGSFRGLGRDDPKETFRRSYSHTLTFQIVIQAKLII